MSGFCANDLLHKVRSTATKMKPSLRIWSSFSLLYVTLPVVLLTLNPFEFQAFTAAEFWVWRFSIEDFSRNVLLLFPFGLMLRYIYRWPHKFSLLAGLLLSSFVEVGQLFVIERTSNVVDLISNSSGALLGSLMYQGVFESSVVTLALPFTFMLMPLCWVISMVSSFRPDFVWAMVPCMVAGLGLFQFISLGSVRKKIALSVWVVAAILPLFNARLAAGAIVLASVPIVLYGLAKVKRSLLHVAIPPLLLISTATILQQTYVWYSSVEDWVWISSRHLSWITLLLSVMMACESLLWYRAEQPTDFRVDR